MMPRNGARSESRFQRWCGWDPKILGKCPRLALNTAPLGLKRYFLAYLPGVSQATGGISPLTLRQQRSWRRGSSSAYFALLPPVPWDPRRSGCRAGTPSVPCPHRERNFEADTYGRQATIVQCRRLASDPLRRRVGS